METPHFNIEINKTSNPNIVKFSANSFLLPTSSFEFKNIDEAKQSPLAQQLFYLPFVKTVYISQNFIAIEKFDIVAWEDVQEEVAGSIAEYLNAGKPVITQQPEKQPDKKKVAISIYAETTPNPSVMKFVANRVLANGTFEFKEVGQTTASPLAKALFGFPFVKEVFISANYISIMIHSFAEWQELSSELREFIRNYIMEGKPVLKNESADAANNSETGAPPRHATKKYSALEKEIISILDEYVKPAVANDGGHILFDSYNQDTKTVKVILQGACSGCPSSTITLKNGIETMLQQMLHGQVNQVVAVNG